ncbi:MAG: S8/S53 family peptidase, partial [Myxococcota bacterium]
LVELLGPGASQALDRQVGRLPKLPEAITQPVTVAILDTMATQSAPNVLQFKSGLEGHGELLARIMGRVLCDDAEQCVAGLRSELAMPYRSSSTGQVEEDRNQGGTYGTVAGLAEALNALAKVHPGSEPLVINLSLGWSPVYGGAQSDARSWPLSVQAVHDALVYARCRGALIFAAAGNQTGGSLHRDGLLLPALWSREAAPGASECAEFGVETDTGTSDGLAPALLYAIGGIDGRGAEIANAREQSQPPLVAHGDQATTRMAKGYTQALTGTSVSTAVVSAIAALVWAHNPTFRTDDVVNALYAFGEDVGAVSATCYGPGCSNRPVRRANACLALTQACAQSSSACAGQVPRCESWKRSAPAAPSGLLADFGAATIPSPVFPASPKSDSVCGPLELYPSVGAHLCPDRQFYSPAAKPWTHPQPGSSPCPNCRAASTLNVIVLESTWVLETSSVLSLQVNGPTSTQTYDLSGVQWPPGSQEGTLMMQPGVLSNAESVTLSMGNGGSNTIVPIPIVE